MISEGHGRVALLGSGETAPASGAIFEALAAGAAAPLRIAVLETPAGFQPNTARVAGKVADILQARLQNVRPEIRIVPARGRDTPFSPDDPEIARQLAPAQMLFLGPGSPTYTVRQLMGSATWDMLRARHRRGASVVASSAATIALGALALPVYEIYKVGSELHWQPGLNFFAPYGLSLVLVPHWNNAEGGADLDTSRCFMGQERWAQLIGMLPEDTTVVGIDEHTGLVIDLAGGRCQVLGRGSVTLLRGGAARVFAKRETFPADLLGPVRLPPCAEGLPEDVWEQSADAQAPADAPPDDVLALVEERQAARARRDWATADSLRREIAARGWSVRDTPSGPAVEAQR